MNKFMEAIDFAEKHDVTVIGGSARSYYAETGYANLFASWMYSCHTMGYKIAVGAALPNIIKLKQQVTSLWNGRGIQHWESTRAKQLGFTVSDPKTNSYSSVRTTQRVHLEATQEDVVEYISNLPKVPMSKIFKAEFTDQGYVYKEKKLHELSLEALWTILSDAENFTFVETPQGQTEFRRMTAVPKGIPNSRLATDKSAAIKSLVGKFVTEDFTEALSMAYGGEWGELQPKQAYEIAYCFSRSKYRQTMLEKEFESTEKNLVTMIDYLEKVQEQNSKLKVMVADAGGSRSFRKKLIQDLRNKAPLEAVTWANHKNLLLRKIAVTILGG